MDYSYNVPDHAVFDKIAFWPYNGLFMLKDVMDYIKPYWQYSECGYWEEENGVYSLSTAGIGSNEQIIAAMQRNHILWAMFWESSRRGGHYTFETPDHWRKKCK
jgi:hypothetical protein